MGISPVKALVNPDTGQVFAIVSKDYRLIPHEETVALLADAIHKSQGLGWRGRS